MFSRIRKAVLGALAATAVSLGINWSDPQWWLNAVVVPIITYLVTYWTPANKPGTALHAEPTGRTFHSLDDDDNS